MRKKKSTENVRRAVFLYLMDHPGNFWELRRSEGKMVRSLRPFPNRDKIYLKPQRNRQQLGEFRKEIFDNQLDCYILGPENLLDFFDEEIDLDFKWANYDSEAREIAKVQWALNDLVAIVVRENASSWYLMQYEVFQYQ